MNANKMDLDISAETADLIRKAPDWNFADDCDLLELMKRISRNLQDRAKHTLESMDKFDFNVKATEITLDNVNNSLRALHYGEQFVEYRVREEDETIANSYEEPEVKPEEPSRSKEEILKEFLENNIKMLRRYYEKRTIEVPDSDDEEGAASTTCIYQLKNPYNKPLPYLIGSKEWNDHWHVGLVESSNEYSDEEKSEEFSESSSSVDANESIHEESFESANVANLSDWASSLSLNNEKKDSNQISTNAAPSPARRPPLVNDSSSSSSQNMTQPRPISSSKRPPQHDLFAALRDSPPSDDVPIISSSTSSSDAFHKTAITQHVQQLPSVYKGANSQQNIFDEDDDERSSSPQSKTSTHLTTPKVNQIKRKPVNLFDDNDFNSFMTEIANKVQTRVDSPAANVVPTVTNINKPQLPLKVPITEPQIKNPTQEHVTDLFARVVESNKEFKEVKEKTTNQTRKTVNLFDDSPPPSPNKSTEKQTSESTKNRITAQSLFEDNPFGDDDFLDDVGTIEEQMEKALNATASLVKDSGKLKFSAKLPLFMDDDDDDDDDLDINKIFARKPARSAETKKASASTSLFGDDDDSDTDLFGNKKLTVGKTPLAQKEKSEQIKDNSAARTKEVLQPKTQPLNIQTKDKPVNDNNIRRNSSSIEQHNKLADSNVSVDLFETKPDEALIETPKHQNKQAEKNDKTVESLKLAQETNQTGNERNPQLPKEIKTVNVFDGADSDSDEFFKNPISQKKQVSFTEKDPPSDTTTDNQQEMFNEQKSLGELKRISPIKSEIFKLFRDFDSDEDELFPTKTNIDETEQNQTKIKPETKLLADNTENEKVISSSKNIDEIPPKEAIIESIQPESIHEEDASHQVVGIEGDKEDEETKEFLTEPTTCDQSGDNIIEEEEDKEEGAETSNQHSTSHTTDKTIEANPILAAHTPSYNSIFMDEPPDDSEFFQTLGVSKLGSSKLFDIENDFDEPALPETPGNSITAADVGQASGISNYGGLQLFSEVPPDDDADEHADGYGNVSPVNSIKTLQDVISRVEQTASGTTRLHTIFYDDFSETATSTATAQPEQISTAPLAFDNEPPPDLEQNEADVVDRSARSDESESTKRAPVTISKLKKPTININVQALLPSTGAIPKVKKLIKPTVPTTNGEKQTIVAAETKTANNSSATSQNLLSSMNKTRVRAPARRRPSTRQARQDNYRKSILDETHPEHDDDHNNGLVQSVDPSAGMLVESSDRRAKNVDDDGDDNESIISPTKSSSAANVFTKPTEPPVVAHKAATAVSHAPREKITRQTFKSFLDTDDDDEDFFASKNVTITQKPTVAASNAASKPKEIIAQKPIATSAKHAKSSIFSSDDDDDDKNDDFLRSLKRAPSKPKVMSKTLFSDVDSDDGDDLFGGRGGAKRPMKVPQHSKKQINLAKSTEANVADTTTTVTVKDNPLADLLGP